jgi:hypothetical protein
LLLNRTSVLSTRLLRRCRHSAGDSRDYMLPASAPQSRNADSDSLPITSEVLHTSLTIDSFPAQDRLASCSDFVEAADSGCVRGMLHDIRILCSFLSDRAHGLDEKITPAVNSNIAHVADVEHTHTPADGRMFGTWPPVEGYSTGMSQPPKLTIFAPRARCTPLSAVLGSVAGAESTKNSPGSITRISFQFMSSSARTAANCATANSRSAGLCAAESCTRIRALPFGTTG